MISKNRKEEVAQRLNNLLEGESGFKPDVLATAPARVNVIGEHVDYNGGWVLPAAIDKAMSLALRKRSDNLVTLRSEGQEGVVSFKLDELEKVSDCWSNYVRGVLFGLRERGFDLCGFDACLTSDVPMGGGLSSSAALEAVFGIAALKLIGKDMDRMELAKLCQKAEHDYAGVPCGLMDQAAVILCEEGKLLLLDCETETYEQAPFTDPHWGLLIINSGVAHKLADGEYAKRRAACHAAAEILKVSSLRHVASEELEGALDNEGLSEEMVRCVRHVVTENQRTRDLVTALQEGEYERAGTLMNESHRSLSEDYRVSCEELDFIAETAQPLSSVAGCRMTGGGFGGSAIALVRMNEVDTIAETVRSAYLEKFGKEPLIFLTRPCQGAEAWVV